MHLPPPQHQLQHQHQHQHQLQHQHQHVLPQQQTQLQPSSDFQYEELGSAKGFRGTKTGRQYELIVDQQPIRARMCGFGDKDRRPITPPPCVRLVVTNSQTGREVDCDEVHSAFFVLMVDLWNEEAARPVNLVRHSNAAPTVSISSSTTTSYPPTPDRPMYIGLPSGIQVNNYGHPVPSQTQATQYVTGPGGPSNFYSPTTGAPSYVPQYGVAGYGSNALPVMPTQISLPVTPINQNHTRNLIGSNSVNAQRLNDLDGKPGFWFVLQDLSVRTEGHFRLKFSIVDVGTDQGNCSVINTGKCPVLASCFSAPFTVYSAKKFPGVIESTSLSKCFAAQGIKIPIRKDGPKTLSNQDEFENDD
ncbi:hypothetical protein P153DRAFT_280951 [Dothidotthia symphoricarpi CBS 119687]|uniref:Velvet domain-containing protein n=1 Tax=Dothidotthia symphoricarpi CBS 119687 TaxID=1392245 RepID=A0A6A6ASS6_9PLEO|nr:uncharacterized protein P153DRAFT_280951 [Dothidotthia symphoricarpi CBS 119687]KAF2134045.1 hypothetical protein P153DRAFT_280951 [Dothidotthia symphoricarpi CBS 119687]